MTEITKNILFVKMPKGSAMCGAACLKMLLGYYSRSRDMQVIWNGIKGTDRNTGRENCQTWKMVQYANQCYLYCAAVTCDEPKRLIDICLKNDVGMIPLYRTDINDPYAHFSVITGKNDETIILNDPEMKYPDGVGYRIKIEEFIDSMKRVPGSEIGKSFTFIIIAKPDIPRTKYKGILHSGEQVEFELPSCLDELPLCALCTANDQWYKTIHQLAGGATE